MTAGEEQRFDWRRGGAAALALIATLVLLGMVVLVAITNTARDRALEAERHAYDVTLLTRTVDSTMSRSEAALGASPHEKRGRMFRVTSDEAFEESSRAGTRPLFTVGSFVFQDTMDVEGTLHHFIVEHAHGEDYECRLR